MALDREILANDLAETLSDSHGINVNSDDVKRGLDAFLEAIKPADPHKAVARVSEFLRAHDASFGNRTDEFADHISSINDVALRASDLRALVRGVETETYTRSLREKLMDRGSLPYPAGVAPIECPTCHRRATVFDGIVQRHLTLGGPPCVGAGQAYKEPEATGE